MGQPDTHPERPVLLLSQLHGIVVALDICVESLSYMAASACASYFTAYVVDSTHSAMHLC